VYLDHRLAGPAPLVVGLAVAEPAGRGEGAHLINDEGKASQRKRERHGYGADFGWAPDEADKYFIRYYDAGYSETVDRNMLTWNFNGVTPSVVTAKTGPATLFVDPNNANGFIDTATFTKKLRDEKEYLDSKVAEIGGKNEFGGNVLEKS